MTAFMESMVKGPRIILVTGHFGSGKTEFSVSLAFALARLRQEDPALGIKKLALCDLDVENPYFRSRELTPELEELGVSVYSDIYHGRNASELQTIDASILSPVENEDTRAIIDLGGNASGAMILRQFVRHIHSYQLLSVVNKNRPGTSTPELAAAEIRSCEEASGLKVTGILSNSHFVLETTKEDVIEGWNYAKDVSHITGIPVLAALAKKDLVEKESFPGIDVFPMGMYMRKSYLDRKV